MTEKILSQGQAAEIGFLRRVRWRDTSCEILRALKVEPRLRIERSQLRWFGHVSRMSHEKLARQVLLAEPKWKRPGGCPRSRWSNNIFDFAWSRLCVEPRSRITWNCWWPWGISSPPGAAIPARAWKWMNEWRFLSWELRCHLQVQEPFYF